MSEGLRSNAFQPRGTIILPGRGRNQHTSQSCLKQSLNHVVYHEGTLCRRAITHHHHSS